VSSNFFNFTADDVKQMREATGRDIRWCRRVLIMRELTQDLAYTKARETPAWYDDENRMGALEWKLDSVMDVLEVMLEELL
jgi:hypothetical protein